MAMMGQDNRSRSDDFWPREMSSITGIQQAIRENLKCEFRVISYDLQ
jgi:hypothetical protein